MLKKLLTGCLTIAMIGAFSASASAETTFTWSGNVSATYEQKTNKAGTDGAKSVTETDMKGTGDLDLVVVVPGDDWTGTAYFDLDFTDGDTTKVDDLYVKMNNESLAISFGEFDPVGIDQGQKYINDEVDNTYGAGNNLVIPGEQGWLQVSLTDVGLDLFVGMNRGTYDHTAFSTSDITVSAEAVLDSTDDGKTYSSTAFGATFKKTFSIVDLGVQYVTMSTSVDENNSGDATTDGALDGLSTNEISLAVTANFSEMMALTLNYSQNSLTPGTSGAKTQTVQTTELVFDMGFSDTMGLSATYGMYEYKTGQSGKGNKYTGTNINAAFNIKTGGLDHYISYETNGLKSDQTSAKEATQSIIGYTMKVGF